MKISRRVLLEVGWYTLLAAVITWNIVIGLVILNADTRRQEAIEATKDDNQRQTEALCILITEQSPKSLYKLDFDTQKRCKEVADDVRNKEEARSSQAAPSLQPSTSSDTSSTPKSTPRSPGDSSNDKPDNPNKPEDPPEDTNLPLIPEGIEDRIGL